ncbi:hypothetical protein E2I00_015503 [Balaenoptera physalus]|uniref:RNA transcription, translation and transport factor protein n=1 Tax=Balaenoptera physalus TaxID=9770 RepID=A0A643C0V7_BALPH|nr:hypothetical protein E2I00_015503 [Balaenoptera physalus]
MKQNLETIVWLEDQKTRHYEIKDRNNLRNVHSNRQVAVDWLLGLAVRLDYGGNAEKYKDLGLDGAKHADSATKNAEPMINLDVNNPARKPGVKALLTSFGFSVTDAVAGGNRTKEGLPVALDKHILGLDTGNAVLHEATQILLHIEELRELQTKMNAARVAVQTILADPKTDHRLGKVGGRTL